MRVHVLQRIGAVLLLCAIVGTGVITPVTAQDATPAVESGLPEGPLGTQIQWLVNYLNLPEDDAAVVDLTTIFSPGVLADVPAAQLQQILSNIRAQLAPVTVDTETMVTTRDLPPTNANFMLVGADGTQIPTSLTVDPSSGLISSIWFSAPVPPAATLVPTETAISTPTQASTETPSATATQQPTQTPTATATLEPTETATSTATQAPTETATLEPTETATLEPTETATLEPTETATQEPTETATLLPTETETPQPTATATQEPTETPTETATLEPTETETSVPTETATPEPTETETSVPTETATPEPTDTPSSTATEEPTETPSSTATEEPTETPLPTETPSPMATATEEPTEMATATATEEATETQSPTATEESTETPVATATEVPTETATATLEPTETATATEENTETPSPTATEEATETASPTVTEEVIVIASPAAIEEATEVASPVATEEATEAASPVGSPQASPIAAEFPSGPLGEQAAWTWSVLNNGGEAVPVSEIEAHVSPELLAQVPAEQVSASLAQLQEQYGPFTLETDSVLVTENEPPTDLTYQVVGQDGAKLQISVSIDPSTGLLTGFLISPAASAASPVAVAVPAGVTDTEVSFTSQGDTIYGSFTAAEGASADTEGPAALIISGSGPTDRNGNSAGLSMNTNLNLAVTLAQEGIPSLRYDKLGSGQTGLASHADGSGIDYELFLQEARDAAAFLSQQPGVDPSKLIIVGHSEGALFALVLAKELTDAGTPPAALILASPLSVRYLDILHEQLMAQLKTAVAAQTMTDDQAAKITTELESIIDSLRTTGKLPATVESPELAQVFSPANAAFLAQIDQIDPAEVADSLPADLPVLVLLGNKDAQVTGDQVRHLMDGFRDAGNEVAHFAALPLADHTLRIVEGEADPSVDYANPDLEFSPQAVTEIDEFLTEHGLAQTG